MGISMIPGLFLARNARHVAPGGRGLVLGRQKLHLKPGGVARLCRRAAEYGHDLDPGAVVQEDGFTEALFAALGYPRMEAMDFTAQEGAEHIHDLNRPPPAELKGQFDLLLDGGTTEHVFHIGQALDTCHALLKPGGVMMSFVAADGWFGHGFFQVGPDVPWRYWHHARGYEVLEVGVHERRGRQRYREIPDPTHRPRGGVMQFEGPALLLYAMRKPMTAGKYNLPVQGHYIDYE